MKPKKAAHRNRQKDLFQVQPLKIIDSAHNLVKLSRVVDWERLEEVFGSTFARIMDGLPSAPD